MLVVENDAAILGIELKHLVDSTDETDHFRFLAVQVHLLLVNLTHIKNLVHETKDALCVVLNGFESLPTRSGGFQFLQSRQDDG